jgi:hypothetical protein
MGGGEMIGNLYLGFQQEKGYKNLNNFVNSNLINKCIFIFKCMLISLNFSFSSRSNVRSKKIKFQIKIFN